MINLLRVCVLSFFLLCTSAQAAVFYVKLAADGGNNTANGTSWGTAFAGLQKAIDACSDAGGGQVWIKDGNYSFDESVNLKSNVEIYGGFGGTESSLTERAPGNVTVLFGTILNARSVSNIKIEGITFKNGQALSSYLSSLSISKCVFENIYEESIIMVSSDENTPFLIEDSTFKGTSPIYQDSGYLKINRCTFEDNDVRDLSRANGGAIYIYSGNAITEISNSTFCNNLAKNGGAIYSESSGDLKILNCTFFDNIAETYGGAIYLNTQNFLIINSIFWGNKAIEVYDQDSVINLGYDYSFKNKQIFIEYPQLGTYFYNCIIEGGKPRTYYYDNENMLKGESVFDYDPMLMPLADNGGYVKTMKPSSKSADGRGLPQSEAPDGVTLPSTDARGVLRSVNSPSIGAVESDLPQLLSDLDAVPSRENSLLDFYVEPVNSAYYTYQWEFSSDNYTWTQLDGETSQTITLTDSAGSLSNKGLRCLISNDSVSFYSTVIKIDIIGDLRPSMLSPNLDVMQNGYISETLIVSGYDPHYEWQVSYDAGLTWTQANIDIAAINFNVAEIADGTQIRCRVYNDFMEVYTNVCTINIYYSYINWMRDNDEFWSTNDLEGSSFGDGITNLEKYVFGLNPLGPTTYNYDGNYFTCRYEDGKAVMDFRCRKELPDASITPLWSADLTTWSSNDLVVTKTSSDDTFDYYTIEKTIAPNRNIFFRFSIEYLGTYSTSTSGVGAIGITR